MQVHNFPDSNALNQYFSQEIAGILRQAIAQRGQAYLVVSGGKTPKSLFHTLAQIELDWQRVTITLTDERCPAPSEGDTNEYMVKESLLHQQAAKANFISLCSEKISVSERVTEIASRLISIPRFDVVILGMGDDGHTASLFPCSAEIAAGLSDSRAPVIAVTPTTAPYQRLSLTKSRLLYTRTIFLHLVGEKKLAVLNQALTAKDPLVMPIRAFLHHPVANMQVMFAPQ